MLPKGHPKLSLNEVIEGSNLDVPLSSLQSPSPPLSVKSNYFLSTSVATSNGVAPL